MTNPERILRRHRRLLVLATIIGAAAAFAISSVSTAVYQSTATLQFKDITELEGFVGTPAGTLQTPAQLAAASARSVTSSTVIAAAKASLGTKKTIDQLTTAASASVDTTSNLVLVSVSAHRAGFAARLANAIAQATANNTNADTRNTFRAEAKQLRRQIRTIPGRVGNITVQNEQADLARLQTLSVIARPATVTQIADVPASPSSPKPAFDTVLGAVLGLLVGALAVFVRERLDLTLRTREQIEEHLDFPVITDVEDTILGTSPLTGSADPLTPDAQSVAARFGLLRRAIELLGDGEPPGVIAVTSAGAEEGKSTVALSLACAFAGIGRRTLLLECDLRRPSVATRLGLDREPGLVDHLLHDASPQETVRTIPVVSRVPTNSANHDGHVLGCVLAGSDTVDPEELLASSAFKTVLKELSDAYQVVIVDTPPLLPVADTLEIIPLVDAIVICVRAHRSRATELKALRATLGRLPARPTVAVSTGWSKLDMELAAKYYGYEGYYGRPQQDVASSHT